MPTELEFIGLLFSLPLTAVYGGNRRALFSVPVLYFDTSVYFEKCNRVYDKRRKCPIISANFTDTFSFCCSQDQRSLPWMIL